MIKGRISKFIFKISTSTTSCSGVEIEKRWYNYLNRNLKKGLYKDHKRNGLIVACIKYSLYFNPYIQIKNLLEIY